MSVPHRSAWRIFRGVIFAIIYRQLRSSEARTYLGYFWVLSEPVTQVIILTVFFGLRGRQSMPGIDFPLFLLTGLIPYSIFMQILTASLGAVDANQGLFVYRQVKPVDAIVARAVYEFCEQILALIALLLLAAWLGYPVLPRDPLQLFILLPLLGLFSLGLGLAAGTVATLIPDLRKIIPWFTRPLFFISGVFFPISSIPQEYHIYLVWNPLLHYLELIRTAWFVPFNTPVGSWDVVLACPLLTLTFGLLVYRRYRLALAVTR